MDRIASLDARQAVIQRYVRAVVTGNNPIDAEMKRSGALKTRSHPLIIYHLHVELKPMTRPCTTIAQSDATPGCSSADVAGPNGRVNRYRPLLLHKGACYLALKGRRHLGCYIIRSKISFAST